MGGGRGREEDGGGGKRMRCEREGVDGVHCTLLGLVTVCVCVCTCARVCTCKCARVCACVWVFAVPNCVSVL